MRSGYQNRSSSNAFLREHQRGHAGATVVHAVSQTRSRAKAFVPNRLSRECRTERSRPEWKVDPRNLGSLAEVRRNREPRLTVRALRPLMSGQLRGRRQMLSNTAII